MFPGNWFPLFLTLILMGMTNFAYPQELQSAQDNSSPAAKIYKEDSGSVFTIYGVGKTNYALGSAVAVGKHMLATNCHVALAGNFLKVKVNDDMKDGTLAYYDQDKDLCLVVVADAQFIPVNVRPSKEIDIGDEVYAIGNREGIERTISKGIISNKVIRNGKSMLQTDAPISHGSSGGGLFDVHGNLIGITTSMDSEGENIGFAIPSEVLLAQISPSPQQPSTPSESPQNSKSNENPNSDESQNEPAAITILGSYGNSNIGLIKVNKMCLITIIGRYENKGKNYDVSLIFWAPTIPDTFMVIPSTADVYKGKVFLYNFLADKNANFQPTRSMLVFDKTIYGMSYDNNLSEKYSIMMANMKGDITQNLIVDNDFLIQFYNFRDEPGMTTIRFELDGFTEALAAYNKQCRR
jgi:serine protease Do